MDKNKCLQELADIKTKSAVCPPVQKLAEILMRVVSEMQDSDLESRVAKSIAYTLKAAASLDKRVEVLESIVRPFPVPTVAEMLKNVMSESGTVEPTGMEILAKYEDDCRRLLLDLIDACKSRPDIKSLSFAEAIELVRETGASVRHDSWPPGHILVRRDYSNGVKLFDGVSYSPEFKLTTKMLDSGWRVLDK